MATATKDGAITVHTVSVGQPALDAPDFFAGSTSVHIAAKGVEPAKGVDYKPDWSKAPEWANWVAMDADFSLWWYQWEPHPASKFWISRQRCMAMGKVLDLDIEKIDWKTMLWKRPESVEKQDG